MMSFCQLIFTKFNYGITHYNVSQSRYLLELILLKPFKLYSISTSERIH